MYPWIPTSRTLRLLSLCWLTGTLGSLAPALHAQEIPYTNPTGYANCTTHAINDSGATVGGCSPASVTAPHVGTYAATAGGTPVVLALLVAGQSCDAEGITASGTLLGSCVTTSNHERVVRWASPTSTPSALAPLPLLSGLSLIPDVDSTGTAHNQNGDVVGRSVTGEGQATVVLWPAGTTTPTRVSTFRDNCTAVDLTTTLVNGNPVVALDCPTFPSATNPGPTVGKIAQATCLLGLCSYSTVPLAVPSGATHCVITSINDSLRSVGTCHTPAPDRPTAAYWAMPGSSPILLTLPDQAINGGASINASGHVLFTYRNDQGHNAPGYWDPVTNTVSLIPPLPGGAPCTAVGLGDNDTVALNCETADQHIEAAVWHLSTGVTTPLGFEGGGQNSTLMAINPAGTGAAVGAEDNTHHMIGGEAPAL